MMDGAYEACESQAGLEKLKGLLARASRSARGSDEHRGAMQSHPALSCVSCGFSTRCGTPLTTGFINEGPIDKAIPAVRQSFIQHVSIGLTLRSSNSVRRKRER